MNFSPTAQKALIATGITALVASMAVNGYLLVTHYAKPGVQGPVLTIPESTSTNSWPTSASTTDEALATSTPALALDIDWQEPKTLSTSTALALKIYTDEIVNAEGACYGDVQTVGTIKNQGEYKDWSLVVARPYCEMGGYGYSYFFLSPKQDKAVQVYDSFASAPDPSSIHIDFPMVSDILPNGVAVTSTLYGWELSAPFYDLGIMNKTFKTKGGNTVYTTGRGDYQIEFPGKRYVYYAESVFTKPNDQLNENDLFGLGALSDNNYNLKGFSTKNSGCGGSPTLVYVDDTSYAKGTEPFLIFNTSDLTKIPSTEVRGSIYRVTNTNHPAYKQAYELWYNPAWPNGKKPSFESFMASYQLPFFLYKDTLGTWTSYLSANIGMAAECGKPVIYLYPTQTTPVHVQLPSTIDVTVSEPTYPKRGWDTVAEPSGKLTMADGSTYGSLFWEGYGATYKTPTTGYIVKGSEVETFLQKTLAQYGLNNQEAKEFMDFWVPLMKPYDTMRVSFVTDEWSKNVPLNVSPKPDTNIRLFMDWSPVSADATITAPTVKTPERKGFTLVEWGGLLRK